MKQEIKEGAAPVGDGGQAFPKPDCNEMHAQEGMSLRDYFAAKAMAAWIGAIVQHEGHNWSAKDFADEAYKSADAMLAARAALSKVPR